VIKGDIKLFKHIVNLFEQFSYSYLFRTMIIERVETDFSVGETALMRQFKLRKLVISFLFTKGLKFLNL
jgi:hypothetical protein